MYTKAYTIVLSIAMESFGKQ